MLPPEEVTNLPLEINGNMRQIQSFATLAPGVKTGQYGSVTIEGGAAKQINSAGTYYNGLELDTASAINSNPPYEMVDEFRVLRSTFSSRYGLVQGAISYNMRSGTNKLHGDGFLIDRNSVFDSAGFFPTNFDSHGHPIAPVDSETDWGGTIGGPVRVQVTSGPPVIASQRVVFGQSFNEVPARTAADAATTSYFNWFDNASTGMSVDNIHLLNPGTAAAT